ncbi:hypothetical protein [Sediminibacillus massiliensis]|uniref:hypothetical protein n=1 Tax=Sediminibacillus massiliensis TaxID=1926277 RepID=UPI0009883FA0|nr:hypothetical protein [Sediminibacillus massiliensis]
MDDNQHLLFLSYMKGRNIEVFKGGPEFQQGKLLDVQQDYLILSTTDNGFIYYPLKHMKSVIEDSHADLPVLEAEETASFRDANNILELLENLKYQPVRINQGRPESRYGRLLSVESDYLVMLTEKDGIIYYNLDHMKSICEPFGSGESFPIERNMEIPPYLDQPDFYTLIGSCKYRWVTINHGEAGNMEGVLVENANDHIILIHHNEIVRIPAKHIKSISLGQKIKQKNGRNTSDNETLIQQTEMFEGSESESVEDEDSANNEKKTNLEETPEEIKKNSKAKLLGEATPKQPSTRKKAAEKPTNFSLSALKNRKQEQKSPEKEIEDSEETSEQDQPNDNGIRNKHFNYNQLYYSSYLHAKPKRKRRR